MDEELYDEYVLTLNFFLPNRLFGKMIGKVACRTVGGMHWREIYSFSGRNCLLNYFPYKFTGKILLVVLISLLSL